MSGASCLDNPPGLAKITQSVNGIRVATFAFGAFSERGAFFGTDRTLEYKNEVYFKLDISMAPRVHCYLPCSVQVTSPAGDVLVF